MITAAEFQQKYVNKSTKEHDVQDSIIKLLLLNKFLVIRFNSGAFTGTYGTEENLKKRYISFYSIKNLPTKEQNAGLSDIQAMKNGKSYFFEVKKPGGIESMNQKKFRLLANDFGITVYVVDSVDKVREIIKDIK